MPLSMVKEGEPNTIQRVGGNEETKRFLENLGFCNRSKGYGGIDGRGKYHCECKGFQNCHRKRYGK